MTFVWKELSMICYVLSRTGDVNSLCIVRWGMPASVDDDVSLAQPDRDELQNVLRTLNSKLEDIRTCSDLIQKHGSSLQRALVDLEQSDSATDAAAKMKPVNERATLFRITSSAMINVCSFSVKQWVTLLRITSTTAIGV